MNQSTLPLVRCTSSAKISTPLIPQVHILFHCTPSKIIQTVGNPIHEHIRIDENSKVAFVENSDRTLCTLSHLSWYQVADIMSTGGIDVFRYPHFMKLDPSLLTYLRRTIQDSGMRWTAIESRKLELKAESILLSVRFSPLVVADEPSLRAAVQSLLNGFTPRLAPYPRSHSPAWEKITRNFYLENGNLNCLLPPSVELSYLSHGVELADFRKFDARCLIHFIHHAAENPSVISIAIHERPILLNYEARGVAQSGRSYVEPYREAGLKGAGQVCGVADSGVDDISCFFLDDSQAYPNVTTSRNGELQPLRRKIVQYVAHADGDEDEAGHGTHVCGSIGGGFSPRRTSCGDNYFL